MDIRQPSIQIVKRYRAILNQTGTNAPVATVLENTIGDIVWAYELVGIYSANLTGAFPSGKTFCTVSNSNSNNVVIKAYPALNFVQIDSSEDSVNADDFIVNSHLLIEVYS